MFAALADASVVQVPWNMEAMAETATRNGATRRGKQTGGAASRRVRERVVEAAAKRMARCWPEACGQSPSRGFRDERRSKSLRVMAAVKRIGDWALPPHGGESKVPSGMRRR